MTTVSTTIDDTLPFSDFKIALSLIHGIAKVEVAECSDQADRQEYEHLRNAFLNSSKRSMSHHISKFIE